MCGIVGYIGTTSATQPVIDGLKALEYRGYDSAGITTLSSEGKITTTKSIGRVDGLEHELATQGDSSAQLAIGHTRWATHGAPTQMNAHPHASSNGRVHVVHNGIIENYQELRTRLQKAGYVFHSDTDTEVIPQLIDYYIQKKMSFVEAFKLALQDLHGAYAIAAIDAKDPETLYAARLSSPLLIGASDKERVLASDIGALGSKVHKVTYLDDYEIAIISRTKLTIHNFKESVDVSRAAETIAHNEEQGLLGDFPHYMLKEIHEAPQTIQSAMLGRLRSDTSTVKLGGLESVAQQLKFIDRIVIVACGTSYYAGLVGEYLIEEIAGIPVEVQLASEFKYRKEPFSRSTALIAISQSGETADTIAALKKVENYGVLRIGIVNSVGSTIARMTDAGVYCHAGPELSVASTKAFIAQVTILTEIALHLSSGKTPLYLPILNELLSLPKKAKEILNQSEAIRLLSEKYSKHRNFLFIGRNYEYPCALEGALKLKEVSYTHAEGYAAGEMKHGPLAMIDEDFPTFALCPDGPLLDKTLSSMEEIRSRKGPIIAIATKGNRRVPKLADDTIYIPETMPQLQPILLAIVMQLFAYHVAVHKGLDVDRPRNLAKSVTVE